MAFWEPEVAGHALSLPEVSREVNLRAGYRYWLDMGYMLQDANRGILLLLSERRSMERMHGKAGFLCTPLNPVLSSLLIIDGEKAGNAVSVSSDCRRRWQVDKYAIDDSLTENQAQQPATNTDQRYSKEGSS